MTEGPQLENKSIRYALDRHRDLEIYESASISQNHQRIGSEIARTQLRRCLKELVQAGEIDARGEKRGRRYFLNKSLPKKVLNEDKSVQ